MLRIARRAAAGEFGLNFSGKSPSTTAVPCTKQRKRLSEADRRFVADATDEAIASIFTLVRRRSIIVSTMSAYLATSEMRKMVGHPGNGIARLTPINHAILRTAVPVKVTGAQVQSVTADRRVECVKVEFSVPCHYDPTVECVKMIELTVADICNQQMNGEFVREILSRKNRSTIPPSLFPSSLVSP